MIRVLVAGHPSYDIGVPVMNLSDDEALALTDQLSLRAKRRARERSGERLWQGGEPTVGEQMTERAKEWAGGQHQRYIGAINRLGGPYDSGLNPHRFSGILKGPELKAAPPSEGSYGPIVGLRWTTHDGTVRSSLEYRREGCAWDRVPDAT